MTDVERSDLFPDELTLVVRACAYLRLPREMGHYFREFLAQSLEKQHPDTAEKVRRLDEDGLRSLYEYIERCQALGD